MDETEEPTPLERAILKEMADIDKKISGLKEERAILSRTLYRARANKIAANVPRKNSIDRVYLEGKIIEILSISKKGMRVGDIYKEMKLEKEDLKETTLRTYLFRLKERGLLSYERLSRRYTVAASQS